MNKVYNSLHGVFPALTYRIPRIVMHAPIYIRNRCNGTCTKSESKVHFFLPPKNRAFSYISAFHCKDLKFSLPMIANFMPKTGIFSGFQRFNFFGVTYISACIPSLYETGHGAPIYEADFSL